LIQTKEPVTLQRGRRSPYTAGDMHPTAIDYVSVLQRNRHRPAYSGLRAEFPWSRRDWSHDTAGWGRL